MTTYNKNKHNCISCVELDNIILYDLLFQFISFPPPPLHPSILSYIFIHGVIYLRCTLNFVYFYSDYIKYYTKITIICVNRCIRSLIIMFQCTKTRTTKYKNKIVIVIYLLRLTCVCHVKIHIIYVSINHV